MKTSIENNSCLLTVDDFGGAITNFELDNTGQINPLSFAFSKNQMPENNQKGAPYQGHFLCLGRWGLPSEGEIKAGMPNHGEAANIQWHISKQSNLRLTMQTTAKLEGLEIEREIILDNDNPVFWVKETVQNINPLGRLLNIVQHPTLASPFLNNETIINCNATIGFDQSQYRNAEKKYFHFPQVKDNKGHAFSLINPNEKYNSVFSFIVDTSSDTGWISAYSPLHHLLFGYVWQRSDYPWIHLWQHWDEGGIMYRGLEFGTAGIHQPFSEILDTATHLFGVKTYAYIDAGEIISKKYFSFMYATPPQFPAVEKITVEGNTFFIQTKENSIPIHLNFSAE